MREIDALRSEAAGEVPLRSRQADLCELSDPLLQAGATREGPGSHAICRPANDLAPSLAGAESSVR